MVLITEEMIRKRSEHNELIISTLEELSLHQQDIERIEHLDRWCRDLKILYLQSNLIPKIEHVGKLKKLEYLNLALNNIEKIENLEGCESLNKLDLTVNFVGELTSVEHLKNSYNLLELFLTGNPCTDFDGYRDYVVATLPQLKFLDGTEIEKSERIKATQKLVALRPWIVQQQEKYKRKREKEKIEESEKDINNEPIKKKEEKGHGFDGKWYTTINEECDSDEERKKGVIIEEIEDSDDEAKFLEGEKEVLSKEQEEKEFHEKEKKFWEEKTAYTPESRVRVHEHMNATRQREDQKRNPTEPVKMERTLQTPDGRFMNVNEAKVDFTLVEDDAEQAFILDVSVFKHMDTSLMEVDVQPTYARVTLKGKVLQIVFQEEIQPDSSTAKRSEVTGHLVLTMPKANQVIKPKAKYEKKNTDTSKAKEKKPSKTTAHLEVDPSVNKGIDYGSIMKDSEKQTVPPLGHKIKKTVPERPNSENFVDDPDVPPLM